MKIVHASFDGAGDAHAVLAGLRAPEAVDDWASTIDLAGLAWAEPVVLVGIACLVEAEVRAGRAVFVERPKNRSVANYLARMRLGNLLTTLGAHHDLPVVLSRDSRTLLELRLFNGSRGAEALAKLVDREVRRVDQQAAEALWEGICETGQNVEQHSGQRFGFVAAQRYKASRRGAKARFMFAVGDSGQGMLSSLATLGAQDSVHAIRLALRPGASEMADPARGTGLPDINEYLRGLGGGLSIVSGNAMMRTHAPRRRAWSGAHHFPGTLVQGEIRA